MTAIFAMLWVRKFKCIGEIDVIIEPYGKGWTSHAAWPTKLIKMMFIYA